MVRTRLDIERAATAIFIGVLLTGCAHSQARCDRRPPSLEQPPPGASAKERDWYRRREHVLQEIRQLNEQGLRLSHAPGHGKGGPEFEGIVDLLRYMQGGGEFLYEQLGDGHWAYRCDDITKLYALAAYRNALVYSDYLNDQPGSGDRAGGYFCLALRARPDVVLPLVRRERLSKTARALFEAAKRNPDCYIEGGWRTPKASSQRPENIPLSGAWGP